jgi:glyoxylase-like metal-dependent hydrolase (beta-lactamase superfamily II)
LLLASGLVAVASGLLRAAPGDVTEVAPGVFFHEGDMSRGHCNNGWIVFDDHVLVIDANFPSGAQVIMPKVRDSTIHPVRVVFDTHHHSDHSYGNRLWAEAGALIVAQVGVVDSMSESEPGAWDASSARRTDLAGTSLKMPTVLFARELFFDDGDQRVELRWFGVGHTRGDGYAWLPKHRILFTGDACVNGPHNYMGDATVGEWIETLELVKKLDPLIVCPGHGPIGGPEVVADQQRFLFELHARVKALLDAGRTPDEARAAIPAMTAELKAIPDISRFVAGGLAGQAERVWRELGGEPFPR